MVLIDIEMPQCCDECDLQYTVGWCCASSKPINYPEAFDKRMEWCPLHETKCDNNCLTNKTDISKT